MKKLILLILLAILFIPNSIKAQAYPRTFITPESDVANGVFKLHYRYHVPADAASFANDKIEFTYADPPNSGWVLVYDISDEPTYNSRWGL